MKEKIFTALWISCVLFSRTIAQTENYNSTFQFNKEAIVIHLSENVYAEILPEIELLSGVLAQTSWIEKMGPAGNGNRYFRRLKAYFKNYKNHEAVEIAEDNLDNGFCYDKPPGFVLQLNPLPELKADSIPEYFYKYIDEIETLDKFRIALKNLSAESNFLEFFKSEKEYLKRSVDSTLKGFDAKRITDWLNEYFGYKGDEFHIVFAPAMFPGGGYGANKIVNGKTIVFQVVRDYGMSEDPFFSSPLNLAELTFHEFGHSFVNPAFEEHHKMMEEFELEELYEPVEDKMRKMAYPDLQLFFNELHIRAMTILAMEKYGGNLIDRTKMLNKEREKGFYLIDFAYSKMREYMENRQAYTTFKNYVPDLLKAYFENKTALIELVE